MIVSSTKYIIRCANTGGNYLLFHVFHTLFVVSAKTPRELIDTFINLT